MSITRLTYPAPRRCSDRTGAEEITDTYWKVTKKPNSKMQFEFDLTRATRQVQQPKFTSRKWGEADVLRHISNGGWFDFNNTEFVDRATREFATHAQLVHQQIMEGV